MTQKYKSCVLCVGLLEQHVQKSVTSFVCDTSTMGDVVVMVRTPAARYMAFCQSQGLQWGGFVQPFSSLPGLNNGSFDFHEGVTIMTHGVTLLTSQSVACNLFMSHFRIASDHLEPARAGIKKYPVPGTTT